MYYNIVRKFYKVSVILLIIFSIILVSVIKGYADNEENIEILAPSAILMEPITGKIIYEKNSHEVRCCASITKVMTMILVMEAIDSGKIKLTDLVNVSEHAASMGGSQIWLKTGEKMSVDDLIKAVFVVSANDGAVALAEQVSGSEDVFVSQMNEKAKALGMAETVFKNCNGLDEEGHVTSAYDVALMSRELIKHKKIFDYTSIWMDYLRDGQTQLVNTNKLLKSYKGITGLKTGTTSKAGSCITATATRGDMSLIGVVLGGANGKERFKDAANLLNYGFASYRMLEPIVDETIFESIKVINGMKSYVNVNAQIENKVLIPKGKEHSISNSIELLSEVKAPVSEGQVLGKLIYKLGDEIIAEYDVKSCESVTDINFSSVFKTLINKFLII